MSTRLSVILKRFAVIFAVVLVLFGISLLFSYDVIKIQWVSFMGIQPSHRQMRDPLPVPASSIPVDGPDFIPNVGVPANPVPADAASIARGAELYQVTCSFCHGPAGAGNGPIAAFLQYKPAHLNDPIIQSLTDGAIFYTITNGVPGRMPPLNENLLVRERWDVVNFVRTLIK